MKLQQTKTQLRGQDNQGTVIADGDNSWRVKVRGTVAWFRVWFQGSETQLRMTPAPTAYERERARALVYRFEQARAGLLRRVEK